MVVSDPARVRFRGSVPFDVYALTVSLWAGPTPEFLLPVGLPVSVNNGQYDGGVRNIASVSAGEVAFVQLSLTSSQSPPRQSNLQPVATTVGFTPLTNFIFANYMDYPEWPDPIAGFRTNRLAAVVNDKIELQAGIFSFANVGYQWNKNGIPMPGRTGVCEAVNFPPVIFTNVILSMPHADFADVGSYSITVQSSRHTTVSEPILLDVIEPLGGRFLNATRGTNYFSTELHARWGRNYRVDRSPDLKHWFRLLTTNNLTGRILIRDDSLPFDQYFYRSVLVP